MAGEWIKMRLDLGTSPKVVRISSALKADRLRVIGGLHAVWCLFDVHSEDGRLDGYSLEALDDMIGFPGFGAAMVSVGWLAEGVDFIEVPRFEEHGGQSAKKRAMETERKRVVRKVSASKADKTRDKSRTREEEEKNIEANASIPPYPPNLDIEAWDRWRGYRKQLGKPLKPASVDEAMQRLAGYGDRQAEVVAQSIANGWQGLFELKADAAAHATAKASSYAERDEKARRARWEQMTGRSWPDGERCETVIDVAAVPLLAQAREGVQP